MKEVPRNSRSVKWFDEQPVSDHMVSEDFVWVALYGFKPV